VESLVLLDVDIEVALLLFDKEKLALNLFKLVKLVKSILLLMAIGNDGDDALSVADKELNLTA
jgi:hypothetical protein